MEKTIKFEVVRPYSKPQKENQPRVNIKSITRTSFYYWLLENWLISSGESKGAKYSFHHRPYLVDIVREQNPYQIYQKSSQVGLSEIMVARMTYFLDTRRGNILYVFPSQEQMRLFVTGRIKPAYDDNVFLASKTSEIFNTEQLKFRAVDMEGKPTSNIAYFTGARERRQMISKDVSCLFIDELDEMNQSGIYTLEKRLDNSTNPFKSMFSTPTFPGYGINHKYVNESDQREWLIKCPACGVDQELTWEHNILQFYEMPTPEAKILCKVCHNPITNESRLKGRWVARRNLVSLAAGYHLSKLMDVRFDANYFLKVGLDPTKIEEFYKSDLGEPFEPSGNKITEEDLISCYMNSPGRESSFLETSMGVDVGDKLNYRISLNREGKSYALSIGKCDWTELSTLIHRYNVYRCVIDINPERTKAKEFASLHPGRVFLADFSSNDRLYAHHHDNYYQVSLHRTDVMTMVIEAFKAGIRKIPINIKATVKDYFEQMQVPIRSYRQNQKTGEMEAYFPKTGKPDHYFFAECYDMIASMLMSSQTRFYQRGIF